MNSNQLTGFIPATIFNISTLQFIDFSYNSLSGSLPVDICYRLSKLGYLDLSQNEFDGLIPSRWYKCSQLQMLSLSYNKFRRPLPSEIGNSTMLRWLGLGGNNLEGMNFYLSFQFAHLYFAFNNNVFLSMARRIKS